MSGRWGKEKNVAPLVRAPGGPAGTRALTLGDAIRRELHLHSALCCAEVRRELRDGFLLRHLVGESVVVHGRHFGGREIEGGGKAAEETAMESHSETAGRF